MQFTSYLTSPTNSHSTRLRTIGSTKHKATPINRQWLFQLETNAIAPIGLSVRKKSDPSWNQNSCSTSKPQPKTPQMSTRCSLVLHNSQRKEKCRVEKSQQAPGKKEQGSSKQGKWVGRETANIDAHADQLGNDMYEMRQLIWLTQADTGIQNRNQIEHLKKENLFIFRIIIQAISMKKVQTDGVKKLKLEDYEIGRTLGRGGFGKVKVAKNKKNGKFVALKLLKKGQIIKAQQIDHVHNENFIHSQISHPFIVNFEGLAQDSRYLYLVLELINGGELFTYLRSVESLPTDQCRFYASTVTLCFEYLHSKNIIFRDLKPENLLIGNDGYLKLTDFGFAKILNEGRTFTICGTPEYIAPEVILNQGHGKAVDWWTLGVLIYEMHAGIDPFSDDDAMGIYKNILKGKVSFPSVFDKQARDAKSLIRHLLVADLSKRYGNLKDGVNDIKKHRWFSGFSWEDLIKQKIKPAYIPTVKSLGDVSNFDEYPDSGSIVPEIKPSVDPFLSW